MRFLHLTLLYCVLSVFFSVPSLEYYPSSKTTNLTSITANPTTANEVEAGATNIIFQSKDGGQTWQDISLSLPENEPPQVFFAGESDIYLRVKNVMYRSKSNLETPVWEKENVPGLESASTSLALNRSGMMAYNYEGQVYKRIAVNGTWLPIYTNFKKHGMLNIFESSNGSVFFAYDRGLGLYKLSDKGTNWKQVQNEGWVGRIVESEGVLLATGEKGIMRSTDKGEHWEWVISEGGVGIAVERIEGGFAAITYNTKTKTRRMRFSTDEGKTWKAIDEGLRSSSSITSVKQLGHYLICGHPDGIFRSSDMGKTWHSVLASVYKDVINYGAMWNVVDAYYADKKVFTIYVSGNTLYAVANNAGC